MVESRKTLAHLQAGGSSAVRLIPNRVHCQLLLRHCLCPEAPRIGAKGFKDRENERAEATLSQEDLVSGTKRKAGTSFGGERLSIAVDLIVLLRRWNGEHCILFLKLLRCRDKIISALSPSTLNFLLWGIYGMRLLSG
ncbi:hypothetical protein NL676_002311 [Syzygium grande]|nr:hypothetical protein NL676_002311 [Syzygium grande]